MGTTSIFEKVKISFGLEVFTQMFPPKFQETRPVDVLKEVWSQVILFDGIPDKDTTNNFQRYIQYLESEMPPFTPMPLIYVIYNRRIWFFTMSLAQDFSQVVVLKFSRLFTHKLHICANFK